MQTLKKSQIEKQIISLKIPAEVSFLRAVRLLITAQLRLRSADEVDLDDLKLAISEFLARAFEAEIVGEYIKIDISIEKNLVDIEIGDFEEFDPKKLFASPYLNFEAIDTLVNNFEIEALEGSLVKVKIKKSF